MLDIEEEYLKGQVIADMLDKYLSVIEKNILSKDESIYCITNTGKGFCVIIKKDKNNRYLKREINYDL